MNVSSFFKRFALLVFVSCVVIAIFISLTPPPKIESAKHEPKSETLPDYDIRTDENAKQTIADFASASSSEADRNLAARAVEKLRTEIPNLKIEYNEDLRIPEVISPDFMRGTNFLTAPSGEKRADILRGFINQNAELIGLSQTQISQLEKTADYTNPDGNLSFVHFEQKINTIPVFRGEIKAGFTKKNEIVRVINNLAPSLDYNAMSKDFGSAEQAVLNAARHLNLQANELKQIEATDLRITFERGKFEDNTTAEKMYFPIDYGVARAAWRVLIWTKPAAFYVIVDAETGAMLWRKNITSHQTQPATYNVYGNTTGFAKTGDSPSPFTPGCLTPVGCPQPTIVPRQTFTLIGNEPPYTFNQLGWITDGENRTIGNAAEAGIDRDGTNGVDPNGWAFGNPNRNFVYSYNPSPGNPAPGEAPVPVPQTYPPSVFQQGSVTNAFYVANRFHDELYRLGFTEQARNFQNDNFGLGGLGGDHISVEVQDSSATNGGNFASPADGGRGRLQCFIWTGSTPDRDAALDNQYIFHELTHGVSSRLHGNGSGLGNQGGMMGEGWSDFYALAMLSEPTDDQLGTHALAGYIMHLLGGTMESNYYYGIRRFPFARKASVGANGFPHNPLTFGYLNVGCDALIGTTTTNPNSAFPRNPVIATSGNCSQVHNGGEIWASALWEVRGELITRHGATEGNRRSLQYITDGMKLAPLNPNMLQERDGIIAAAATVSAADRLDVIEGFRIRGMGFSASVQSATAVTESFDLATLNASQATVTSGNNLLEPNECNTLDIPIVNNSSNTATAVSAVLSSNTPGITITQPNSAYPNIAAAGTAGNTTPFELTIDNTVMCYTTANFTLTVTFSGSGGNSPAVFNFSLPVGLPGLNYATTTQTATIPAGGTLVAGSQADDAAVAIPLPAGWASTVYNVQVTSLSASTNGNLTVNGTAATTFTNTALPGAINGTNPTLMPYWDDFDMDPTDTTDGGIYINTVGTSPNRQLYIEWRATHFSETTTAISTNFAIVLTESSDVVRYIYASTGIGAQLNGASATVGVQRQSTGTQNTQFSFNTASLSAGLQITFNRPGGICNPGGAPCPFIPNTARADFDGDGRSDISVFRPSEGNWYLNRSTAGFGVVRWGISTDKVVPGDYDGDGKTDFAVFRKGDNSTWYILNSSSNTVRAELWGASNIEQAILFDTPVASDYDGDGKTDLAVWRLTDNLGEPARFLIKQSTNNAGRTAQWGNNQDRPVPADYDGDRKTDLAIFRGGNWWILNSTDNAIRVVQYGLSSDKTVPADYDGDGREDIAVYRPSTGTWYINNVSTVQFGISTDIPAPADYDGDGRTDIAVFRNGTWWINRSTAGVLATQFGLSNDIPIPSVYLP